MGRVTLLLGTLAVLLAGAVTWLFWVQNSERTALLSLNLGFAAWQLAAPAPLPAIVAASAGAGFLAGAVLFGGMTLRSARRARRAESQVALGAASAWSAPPKQPEPWTVVPKAEPSAATSEKSDGWK